MNKTMVLFSGILLVTLVACGFVNGPNRSTYLPNEIEVLGETVSDRGITLNFRPPSETMYFCAGARYRMIGTDIHYELVRSRTTEKQSIDVEAKPEKDGSLSVTFPFPDSKPGASVVVQLVDSTGKAHGRWEEKRRAN